MKMTHQLRADHDAILVGIGTVLADDPGLTVRLVTGPQPQPVVLDGRLRFPLSAKLLNHPKPPWIFTTDQADPRRLAALKEAGVQVWCVERSLTGQVSLTAVLDHLGQVGIGTVMVEGGATVITSFIMAQLADQLVVTIAPTLLGGLHAVGHLNGHSRPRLQNPKVQMLGQDMVVRGDVAWG
jgi:riboflavin-specific deaminase-like protein